MWLDNWGEKKRKKALDKAEKKYYPEYYQRTVDRVMKAIKDNKEREEREDG